MGGHEANLNYGGGGRDIQLCVARAADSPPLCRVEVLVRGKAGLRVPTGCLLMRGDDGACKYTCACMCLCSQPRAAVPRHTTHTRCAGKPRNLNAGSLGSSVFLGFARARPTALLLTPLTPTVLDVLSIANRPLRCGRTALTC